MSILRGTFRAFGFTVLTLFLYSLYLAGRGCLLLLRKDPTRWRNGVVRCWATSLAFILNMDIKLKGTPPDPPFLLVSNHLSYVDILPFFISMDCVFVAKSEVRSWPVLGRMAEGINIIFIDRSLIRDIPRVNRLIDRNINDKQGVILFPEGTTTNGETVKRFKSSLLKYAASKNFPVSYASIRYCTSDFKKPAKNWVCWWGDQSFTDHFIKLLTVPSIRAVVTFGDNRVKNNDRKKLAKKLQKQVESQFIPTASAR